MFQDEQKTQRRYLSSYVTGPFGGRCPQAVVGLASAMLLPDSRGPHAPCLPLPSLPFPSLPLTLRSGRESERGHESRHRYRKEKQRRTKHCT